MMEASDLVLSMRLHAIVLASMAGTPAIGLSIDPTDSKILSFSKLVCQDALPFAQPSVGDLIDLSERLLSDSERHQKALLSASVLELQKKARKDLANILRMIYNEKDQ